MKLTGPITKNISLLKTIKARVIITKAPAKCPISIFEKLNFPNLYILGPLGDS